MYGLPEAWKYCCHGFRFLCLPGSVVLTVLLLVVLQCWEVWPHFDSGNATLAEVYVAHGVMLGLILWNLVNVGHIFFLNWHIC